MHGRKKSTEECGREEQEGGRAGGKEGAAEEDEAGVKGQAACGHQGRTGRLANPLLCLPLVAYCPSSLLPRPRPRTRPRTPLVIAARSTLDAGGSTPVLTTAGGPARCWAAVRWSAGTEARRRFFLEAGPPLGVPGALCHVPRVTDPFSACGAARRGSHAPADGVRRGGGNQGEQSRHLSHGASRRQWGLPGLCLVVMFRDELDLLPKAADLQFHNQT